MSTSAGVTHLASFGGHACEEITTVLQQTLVDLIDLGLFGKQLHWAVVGKLFRPLHTQLDELVESTGHLADTVAERMAAVGGNPDGQASTVASSSQRVRFPPEPVEAQESVRAVAYRLHEAAERTRDRMNRLGELDVASQDVLIEVVRELEKQLWMVRVQSSLARK
jgi:starvation-inducible DNA-binding protein